MFNVADFDVGMSSGTFLTIMGIVVCIVCAYIIVVKKINPLLTSRKPEFINNKLVFVAKKTRMSSLRNTKGNFLLGMIVAMFFVLCAFNIESRYVIPEDEVVVIIDDTDTLVVIPPTFYEKPPPPPPPPPPTISEIIPVEDIVSKPTLIEKKVEPVVTPPSIVTDGKYDDDVIAPPPPPPLPPPVDIDVPEIFKVVEAMPRFYSSCESEDLSKKELYTCSQNEMLKYIYKHLSYPAFDRKNGIEGTVIMQFVVSDTGEIVDVNIVRTPSPRMSAAALKVVENMQEWIPGMQGGRNVKVLYTLPIKFKLE